VLVADDVVLVAQIHGEQAVRASLAIKEKGAGGTIGAILREEERVALVHVGHLVAVVRLGAVAGIGAADGLDDLIPVEAILIELGGEDQVAVLVGTGMIDELRILVVDNIECETRHDVPEFFDLRNKRPAEIHRPPEVLWIPLIRPPAFCAVDGEDAPLRVHGDDRLSAEIACPSVQAALVPPEETTLLPAIGAERGRRDRIFLATEHRRELVELRKVGGSDLESR